VNVPTLDRTQLSNRGNAFPFVDPATETDDCNVSKVSEAIEYFNGHQLTAHEVRSAGHDLSGPTGNVLARKVFLSEGLVDGTDFITANPKPLDDLRTLRLQPGWVAGVYIDYGVLNALAKGDPSIKTGDRNYTGIHCTLVWGWRRSHSPAGILVWDHDPLFDGRRPAIPYGRQHVSVGPLLAAAQAAVPKLVKGASATGLWCGWAVKIPL